MSDNLPALAVQPCLVRMRLDAVQPPQVCILGDGLTVEAGRRYVVTSVDGERIGEPACFEPAARPACRHRVVGTVTREATCADVERETRQAALRTEVLAYCRQRVRDLDLPVWPVAVATTLDRDTVTLTYAAEQRIDLRSLARELARRAHRRVELRSVGVRDKAKTCGGLGRCGRMLCCTTFMTRFTSVTIRMAKAQSLALNPARISGQCGRLMCCLAHEEPTPQQPDANASATSSRDSRPACRDRARQRDT
jgi:cell fate regulator YaaT (PSP1 superfamily)